MTSFQPIDIGKEPNPGSDAAIAKGCTCPILDNARGKGDLGGNFWISGSCKLHTVEVSNVK